MGDTNSMKFSFLLWLEKCGCRQCCISHSPTVTTATIKAELAQMEIRWSAYQKFKSGRLWAISNRRDQPALPVRMNLQIRQRRRVVLILSAPFWVLMHLYWWGGKISANDEDLHLGAHLVKRPPYRKNIMAASVPFWTLIFDSHRALCSWIVTKYQATRKAFIVSERRQFLL